MSLEYVLASYAVLNGLICLSIYSVDAKNVGWLKGYLNTRAAITMALTQDVGSFPMVYGRKNLFSHSMGIIPEVFVHELHGNVATLDGSISLC